MGGVLDNAEALRGGMTNQGTCNIRLNFGSAAAYIPLRVERDSEPQWPPDEGGQPLSQNNKARRQLDCCQFRTTVDDDGDVVEGHNCFGVKC